MVVVLRERAAKNKRVPKATQPTSKQRARAATYLGHDSHHTLEFKPTSSPSPLPPQPVGKETTSALYSLIIEIKKKNLSLTFAKMRTTLVYRQLRGFGERSTSGSRRESSSIRRGKRER